MSRWVRRRASWPAVGSLCDTFRWCSRNTTNELYGLTVSTSPVVILSSILWRYRIVAMSNCHVLERIHITCSTIELHTIINSLATNFVGQVTHMSIAYCIRKLKTHKIPAVTRTSNSGGISTISSPTAPHSLLSQKSDSSTAR